MVDMIMACSHASRREAARNTPRTVGAKMAHSVSEPVTDISGRSSDDASFFASYLDAYRLADNRD